MKKSSSVKSSKNGLRVLFSFLSLFVLFWAQEGYGAETFLTPYQQLDIRAPFPLQIREVLIREGEIVEPGTLLVSLDSRVLEARKQQLERAVTFHGMLDSAQALVKMQHNRLTLVEKLNKSGNARRRELEKVKTDLAVAKARLLEAEEKQLFSQMELEVIRAQIEERKLRSPITAIVLKVYKQQSEMALSTDMEPILTLVQLDPLMAMFHFAVAAVADIRVGQKMSLNVAGIEVEGEIDFISPVIDAQSGTIAVRFRLQNPEGRLRSGDRIIYTAPNYKEK